MKKTLAIALACVLALAACSKQSTPTAQQAGASARPAVAPPSAALKLPVTMEGTLALEHSNDWGSWGSFTVQGVEYSVAIPANIYEASRLGEEGGNARLTLSGQETKSGITIYQASAAQRM